MEKKEERKVINNLKYRKLEEQHYTAICKYLNYEITWLEAHNTLIPMGIYLAEDGQLLDY